MLAAICCQSLFAQRVDLDKFGFTASFRNFPDDPLPDAYRTYNVRIEAVPSLANSAEVANAVQLLDIAGMKKVAGTGHITILAILDDILIESVEGRERAEIKKDKQGVETKKMYYFNELVYSFGARASVYDYMGNTLVGGYMLHDREKKMKYKTPEFASAEAATDYYTKKVLEIRMNLNRQLIGTSITALNGILNFRYGYVAQQHGDILWILNNKKHPAYKEHQKAWNSFRDAMALMRADESLTQVKQKLLPVIDYFERAKTRYTTSSKEDRKLRYASYFNLSKIYYYLDEPENALKEADALAMNGYDESDGRFLRSAAEQLRMLLQRNQAESRHFAINAEMYQSPVR